MENYCKEQRKFKEIEIPTEISFFLKLEHAY